jgi:DNA repair protein RadC
MGMPINQWPGTERPREKLLAGTAAELSDAEVLAVVLQNGTANKSALALGRELLAQYGSIKGVLRHSRELPSAVKGVGPAKVALLEAAKRYLQARYGGRSYEAFICIYLNSQQHIVKIEELFRGTIDGAPVYPGEVVKRCLHYNAAAVIFAHNHPSGVAEPSQADIGITRRLQAALQIVDIRVLDHLVVAEAEVVSLAERNLLD